MNACSVARERETSPTWTDGWRLECEARWLLGMPLKSRQAELAHPARQGRRGVLEVEMRRLWDLQKRKPE